MKTLTKSQQARLKEQEEIIEQGLTTFREVGDALMVVRDEGLYPQASFEVYCRERWGFGPNYANRVMRAASVTKEIEPAPNGAVPTNERQARALADVEPERRQEVWNEAVSRAPVDDRTGKPKVTAELVREVADEEPADHDDDPRAQRANEALVRFDEVQRAFRQLKNEIRALREEGHLAVVTNGLEMAVESAHNQIKDAIPFATCPHCDGVGCETCKGRGWLCKAEFGQLSNKHRAKAVTL